MSAWSLRSCATFVFVGAMLAASVTFAQIQLPELTGRVVDGANLLPDLKEAEVVEMLRQHEAESGDQVVVATVQTLQGRTIEEFAVELARHWGIGQEGNDNGVLLLVAPNERQIRIEVGYGLEDVLTDARASAIIANEIVPPFRAGDRPKGVVDGVTEILSVLKAGRIEKPNPNMSRGFYIPPPVIIWIVLLVILFTLRANNWGGWRSSRRSGRRMSSMSGRSSSSGRGGFSGGGGSFGGGGSTGSW